MFVMKRVPFAALFTLLAFRAFAGPSEATLFVDCTDVRRGVFHTHVVLPATAGPMTFVYPKWIPGEHTPTGPLMQMAGLHVRAGGKEIAWTRDGVDLFAFHIEVPPAANAVDIDFDYLSPSSTFGAGYGESANSTQQLLLLPFNHVVLYPANTPSDNITFRASVKLPPGWTFDTALPVAGRNGERIDFAPASLTTLIDSPLVAGAFMRTVPIADAGRERLTITADSAPALALPDSRIAQLRKLVAETDALFGARHYGEYHWLVTLSDLIEPQGLEHHHSTDIRAKERAFVESDWTARTITILSHEFVHSWNGKYRRPAGLATPDYQAPMSGEMLYVYEGMTRYFGDLVVTARSGMRTAEEDREFAAWVAANQDRNRPGREWRPLVDTAVAVASINEAPGEEVPYRRSLDYYDESMLVWLDADTIIRARTNNSKSLDDFARLFFGAPATRGTVVKPYTVSDLVAALNQIAPYDWRGRRAGGGWLAARLQRHTERLSGTAGAHEQADRCQLLPRHVGEAGRHDRRRRLRLARICRWLDARHKGHSRQRTEVRQRRPARRDPRREDLGQTDRLLCRAGQFRRTLHRRFPRRRPLPAPGADRGEAGRTERDSAPAFAVAIQAHPAAARRQDAEEPVYFISRL